VTAVALCSESKLLAQPSVIDSLPTSANREDHVSMGMTSALKLRRLIWLIAEILAIELMCAAQGLEYRKPLRPGRGVLAAYNQVRRTLEALVSDRPLGGDIEALAIAVRRGDFNL
jgi:histidine ammonia-lyase